MAHYDEEELKTIKPGPISWLAAHPVAANLLMVICLAGGLLVLTQTKQEVFPEFQMDQVTVTMMYPGASPEEVEQGIILPIEDAIRDVDGIDDITATAYEGYGHVIAEMENEDESIRISQDIKTAVDQISTFPVDAEDLTVTLSKNEQTVLELVLYGSVNDHILRATAEQLRDQLEQHEGISLVEFSGVRDYEIHIEIPEANLRRYNLNIPDIANLIGNTSLDIGGGSLETSSGKILVRMTERRDYAREFRDIPIIKNANGSKVTLGEIATVREAFSDSNIYASYDGKSAIAMTIDTTEGQTPISVSRAANDVVERFEQTLPGDLSISIVEDRSIIFEQRAELLVKNGLLGLILVVIFLALFLDVRLAFWVSMGIPISYMGAFLILANTDFSINMISMFAFIIALGIVVDDAIVVGENIYHKREQGRKPLHASVEGAREMAIPVMVSVLTNIVAFMPMLFIPGFTGKIFSIIPMAVISAFLLSLFESLFILPAHLTFKQSKNIRRGPLLSLINIQKAFNRKFDYFVRELYAPFLIRSVYFRYISFATFLAILIAIASYVLGGHIGLRHLPKIESDFSYARAVLKVGSPEETVRSVEQRIVKAAQEIIAQQGGDKLAEGVYSQVDENTIQVRTFLTDPEIRTMSTSAFTKLWREKTGEIAGLEALKFQSDLGGPGAGAALTVQLSHSDTDILDKAAIDLAVELEQYPRARDIDDGSAQGKRQFDFTMTDLGYTLGLTPLEVGRQVRGAFYGSEALKQQRGRNEVRILVKLPEEERSSAYHFKNMMIKAPNGEDVMLLDVVNMTEGRAYTTINRNEGRRVITVTADINPESETHLVTNALEDDVLPVLQQKYPGLTYSFEGKQADLRESLNALMMGMIAALFVMYAILAALFSSYSQPIKIMIAIPFSMVGALVGHFIMGFSLSMVSLFGIIALAGVVINDSLILIDLANRKRKDFNTSFEAVVEAGKQRFRPIMLTTLTTFMGLAPMMFETSLQARFLIPMAISLGFGIVFATFLTLVLVPSLYMINEDIQNGVRFILGKKKKT